ncbi:type I glyceraldehyde-3-phosphate dehydrogenase [Buchnera aphidicola]|uniref:Glyceraldehyde-3-phosphate dehydrogenase n=1 Tax=Buchnera aphidicola (Artemisaphis artemisicola) TaxID=1241836 RepID=A0A4D6XIG6_9GAMM|nr:type I glyceraldehyde-3-phosphate dehydrogenase [Buchnera aphidicola]QCI15973.1 type I glyceraldehyde-3-phosphate dehydrogenase [Buchnera aphidicola (Artemisaphis artemisicola)]
MTIKVGINGFGRIGRVLFRLAQKRSDIEIIAINDLLSPQYIAYMLKYDSTHGLFKENIEIDNNDIIVNGKKIRITAIKDPEKLMWNDLCIDVVIESTGLFLTKETAYKHILAGSKKVVVTGPSKDDIPMFVRGANFHKYKGEKIVSNASCTTNCLAPLSKIIDENFDLIEGLMTTVHASTATQKIVDSASNKDWRGGRGALQNIIPSSTGAAIAVGKVLPNLNGKLTGIAFRVPVSNISVVDLTVRYKKSATYKEICQVIQQASKKDMKGILGYTEDEVVSTDFNGQELTCIFDSKAGLCLNNNFAKLVAWYDNETGYSSKVLDLVSLISRK